MRDVLKPVSDYTEINIIIVVYINIIIIITKNTCFLPKNFIDEIDIYGKNDFAEISKILVDTDQKSKYFVLNSQNNYVERSN